MKYKVLTGETVFAIILQTQEHIDDGWEPLGGVSVAVVHGNGFLYTYAQALTKKD